MLGRALAGPVAPGKPEKLNRQVISDLFLRFRISDLVAAMAAPSSIQNDLQNAWESCMNSSSVDAIAASIAAYRRRSFSASASDSRFICGSISYIRTFMMPYSRLRSVQKA
jgi:hypothetical protein